MAMTTVVEDKLYSEAEFGLFFAYQKITKKKADELRTNGLQVADCNDSRSFPRLHYISWKNAKVNCEDVSSLDEKSDEYTLAQKLWIVSMKNQPKN